MPLAERPADRANRRIFEMSVQDIPGDGRAFQLGKRVKALRQAQDMTLKDISGRSGISTATLSKIENNLLSPTYENIIKLADGLSVSIDALFSDGELQSPRGRRSITTSGEGQIFDSTHYRYEMLCTDLAPKKMIPLKATIKSRERRDFSRLIKHAGEEVMLVLSGEVELHTEFYTPTVLKAGDCAYFDSTMGHVCVLHGREDAEVFWVCSSTSVIDLVANQQ
jgi:transcriptional regulator with XRE-family HTH domain